MDRVVFSMLCLWAHVVVGKSDIKTIWCVNDDVQGQHNLVKVMKREDVLCTAKEIDTYPFTLEQHLTPPKPESINVTYRTYRVRYNKGNVTVNTRQIAVLVSWTYKIQYFKEVESYHIEVNYFKPPGSPRQYLMTWNATLTSVLESLDSKLVKFNFVYCGRPDNFHVHPRDVYRFRIQACPVYGEREKPQAVNQFLKIPGCDDKAISKVPQCVCDEGYERKRGRCRRVKKEDVLEEKSTTSTTVTPGTPKQQQKLSSTHVVLLVIGVILIILFITLAVWAYRERKAVCGCFMKKPSSDKRHVLLICNLDVGFFEPMNNLINIFSEFPHLEVKSNLRQRNEIGELGIHEWTKKHVNNADVVAFLIASTSETFPDDKKDNENALLNKVDDQVGLVLRATEKIIINNKADNADKKFIIVDMKLSTKRDLPYFKHCKLPSDFNKFAKIVIGGAGLIKEKDRRIFQHSLAIAELGGYYNRTAPEDQLEKSMPAVEEALELSNDLNSGTEQPNNQSLDVINITDGMESYNNFQSQPYFISAESNADSSWQFNESGARPKQSC